MSLAMNFKKAKEAIERFGFVLVFPIKNKTQPNSIWNVLHPHSEMRWEWDTSGDNRLFDLWRLREQLASSHEVVYGKYYQGRATFFSKSVFTDLLAIKGSHEAHFKFRESKIILETLEMDSPLSTKSLKELSGLKGKYLESQYSKSMKELWKSLSIVGLGEIDDGAFPSLAHGATQTVFEELWINSTNTDIAEAWLRLCELPDFDLLEKNFLQE